MKTEDLGGERVASAVGAALVPSYITLGLFLPASDLGRGVGPLVLVASGALIGRWWAAAPSMLTFAALALAEEANHRGFGPGARIGTGIELHTGAFSVEFFLFAMLVATVLPTIGVLVRKLASRAVHREPS